MANSDFNGDGFSDILWRNSNGVVTNWLGTGTGTFVANHANALTAVPTDWVVHGTGDFNGDGRTDVLWRHSSGVVTNWLGTSDGGFQANHGVAMTGVPFGWSVAGTGDFNGDGRDDVLWRHLDGTLTNWLGSADGGFVANHSNAMTGVPVEWQVAGVGDFNGDGRDDILWQGYDHITNWLGDADGGFTANHDAAMTKMRVPVVAIGDFNGDSRDDVVIVDDWSFYSSYSARADGSFDFNAYDPFGDATMTTIVGVGDYNFDDREDLLVVGAGSQMSILAGTLDGQFDTSSPFASVPPSWFIQPNLSGAGHWDY